MGLTTALSFSGGKDSTAVLLRLHELDTPPDHVVMFDEGTWAWPQMARHVANVEQHLGIKIKRVFPQRNQQDISLDDMFDKHVYTKGKRKGDVGYGWPHMTSRWCTRTKTDALDKWFRHSSVDVVYIGIAADESHRSVPETARFGGLNAYPLIDWDWTEKDALQYCMSKGYDWEGLYHHFDRVSCFCCPLQPISDLRALYEFYPSMWARLEDMQHRVNAVDGDARFKRNRKGYGESVLEWRRRFQNEGFTQVPCQCTIGVEPCCNVNR